MSDRIVSVDWTATQAADWLMRRSLWIRGEAQESLDKGYGDWFYEYTGMAVIAEKAARAELYNLPDPMKPCGICKGRLACDITYHRSLA